MFLAWNNGKEVAEIQKMSPQQLGDVNKQESGDSRPLGARHGDTAANHTDLQSRCGRTLPFMDNVRNLPKLELDAMKIRKLFLDQKAEHDNMLDMLDSKE